MARKPEGADEGRSLTRDPGERWGHFATRVANAFGLVLLLVLATYVLQDTLDKRAPVSKVG